MRDATRHPGNTLTEYSIALGLVALIAVFGLKVLGPAIQSNVTEASQAKGTISILSVSPGGVNASKAISGVGGSASIPPPKTSMAYNSATPVQVAGSSSVIQVSGSNGSSGKVYANSQKIFQIAQKYKDTDPATYNLIMKLGQQGQTVGTSMMGMANSQFGQSNAINEFSGGTRVAQASQAAEDASKNFNSQSNNYRDVWGFEVKTSPEYAAMSPEDQQTIYNLAEESVAAMQNYTPTETDASNLASTVHDNGKKTEACGANGHC